MTKNSWRSRARRALAVLTATTVGGALAVAGATPAAAQDAREIVDGSAEWGVKTSFREYVRGAGDVDVVAPATQIDGGGFNFAAESGTVNSTEADIQFAGSVEFRAHYFGGTPALELIIDAPRVQISGDTGTLIADVSSRDQDTGDVVEYPKVELATIAGADISISENQATVSGAELSLTEAGVPAFGAMSMYEAGEELDPLSFSVNLTAVENAEVAPEVTTQPQSVTAENGEAVEFTAAASGEPEPTVQWQISTAEGDWQDVEGATTTTLTLDEVTADDDGLLVRAIFTNGVEPDAVTDLATLTVTPATEDEDDGVVDEPGEGEGEEPGDGEDGAEDDDSAEDPDEADTTWEPSIEVFQADGETRVTEIRRGDTIVVKGTGFDPQANVGGRGMPIPATLPQGAYVVIGDFAEDWRPSAGAASSERTVLSRGWVLPEDTLDQVPAPFDNVIRAEWVELADDGSFTAELTFDPEGPITRNLGVYTYGAGGVDNPAQELYAPLVFRPTMTATPTEGVQRGTNITVTGSDFAPNRELSVAITATDERNPTFGWRSGWVQHHVTTTDDQGNLSFTFEVAGTVNDKGQDCVADDCVIAVFNSAQTPENGEADHRAERDQDVEVPVTFVAGATEDVPGDDATDDGNDDAVTWEPQIEVFQADGVTPVGTVSEGDTIVVKGSGFDPGANIGGRGVPIPNDLPQGTYLVLGGFDDQWRPSEGAPSGARTSHSQQWVLAEDVLDEMASREGLEGMVRAVRASWVELNPDGTFEAEIEVAIDPEKDEKPNFGVYTYAAGGVTNADQEIAVPLTFATDEDDDEPAGPAVAVDPEVITQGETAVITGTGFEPGTEVSAVISAPGRLEWGVSESFRNYVTGSIAQGSVTTVSPATASGEVFVFGDGQGEGTIDDAEISFGGGVHFAGHDLGDGPVLQVKITDPRIVIDGTTGFLIADVESSTPENAELVARSDVQLAALDFDAGELVLDGNVLTARDVPAALTEAGEVAFGDFYEAGEALAPVSFTVTLGEGIGLEATTLPAATVAEDSTVTFDWQVAEDAGLGVYRIDLVTDGESLAHTTAEVVASSNGNSGTDDNTDDNADDAAGGAAGGGNDASADALVATGAETAALIATAAAMVLAGTLAVRSRRKSESLIG